MSRAMPGRSVAGECAHIRSMFARGSSGGREMSSGYGIRSAPDMLGNFQRKL